MTMDVHSDTTGHPSTGPVTTERPDPDQLDAVFAALADPTRRAILVRLTGGQASVNELAEPFAMTTQSVSKHLAVLERAGLISRTRRAQWRPCRLEQLPLTAAASWIATCRPPLD